MSEQPTGPSNAGATGAGASGAGAIQGLLNPIVLVVLLIIVSVILLIGAAVLGIDKGVLRNMARSDFARGLVTYLFAIVTIGTAVVMVLSGLLGADDVATEKRFQRGKEILSLLLGVFGTIVGFYFGSEVGAPAGAIRDLALSPVRVERAQGDGGQDELRAVVTGGKGPYVFTINVGNETVVDRRPVSEDGWIIEQIGVPAGGAVSTRLIVEDDTGERVERAVPAGQSR